VIPLSRDGPVRREIPHPGSGPTPSSQNPHIRPDIFSPLFVAPREETTLRPSTPLTRPSIRSGIQRPGNRTKRRFRPPTGFPRSPRPHTSDLQVEDVDFETRLASYSDDELNSTSTNSRKMTKEERRGRCLGRYISCQALSPRGKSRRGTSLPRGPPRPTATQRYVTLVFKIQKSQAKKWPRLSQAFVALNPRSMEKASISNQ
jgi:hypothetical protein